VFLYIALFVLVYNTLKAFVKHRAVKDLVVILGSVLVLLTVVVEHTLIVLGVLSVLVFFCGKLLQHKRSKWVLALTLLFVIILFCIRNYPFVQHILESSYLSFINEPILVGTETGYFLYPFPLRTLAGGVVPKNHPPFQPLHLPELYLFLSQLPGRAH
jgi:hypothetical protein